MDDDKLDDKLDAKAAMALIGCRRTKFDQYVRDGIVPAPIYTVGRRRLWTKKQIREAVDRLTEAARFARTASIEADAADSTREAVDRAARRAARKDPKVKDALTRFR